MTSVRIAIVGGGLAGLHAAYLLERAGIHDYVLIEARETLGGRIAYLPSPAYRTEAVHAEAHDRFDLGPTWFWPTLQPALAELISDLGLTCFAQYETGDTVIEQSAHTPPFRLPGYVNSPTSMRLIGGMNSLIDALHRTLNAKRIITGFTVQKLSALAHHIVLEGTDPAGQTVSLHAQHILLAVPPRIAERTMAWAPLLPDSVRTPWRNQPTWMAPHAKYVAIYPKPFWRDVGLSGQARSNQGPLGEIHDASMPGGSAALFGFFAYPANRRSSQSEAQLRAECRAQLTTLFGPQAATPVAETIKEWAAEPYTATAADVNDPSHPMENLATGVTSGPWLNRLTGIGSEWSRQFPGYLAGAIAASQAGVQAVLASTAQTLP